ncbi:MAG: hypothetical protein ACREHD_30765 [Pirellulales bacterium]
MYTKLVAAVVVASAMAFEAMAFEAAAVEAAAVEGKSPEASTVAWRGGYRYRRYSYSAAPARTYSSYRGSIGRSSTLDYPAYTQPYSTRINQWNKYPNQPFYLRGERKSLLILP